MHPNAISKARLRLEKARECIDGLRKARNHGDFSSLWVDVLIALNGVPNLLQEGAKRYPQSRQWYGGKKKFGRNDPLLSYMYQARNAEEHGLSEVIKHQTTALVADLSLTPNFQEVAKVRTLVKMVYYNITFNAIFEEGTKLQPITLFVGESILVSVYDERFDKTFQVPTVHLGKQLGGILPITAARLTYDYYCSLIDEAEKFVFSPIGKVTDVIAV